MLIVSTPHNEYGYSFESVDFLLRKGQNQLNFSFKERSAKAGMANVTGILLKNVFKNVD